MRIPIKNYQLINWKSKLDFFHRDPFDRMIIAQAATSDLKVISKDKHFKSYNVEILW